MQKYSNEVKKEMVTAYLFDKENPDQEIEEKILKIRETRRIMVIVEVRRTKKSRLLYPS